MESISKQDVGIRIATRADEHESRLKNATSWDQCADLAGEFHRAALQKGRELIEARFWLGGAVARAHSYTLWGDNYFGELSKTTGIGQDTLRKSMALWDMFTGNVVDLHHWVSEFVKLYGNVMWGDIHDLVTANRQRIQVGRHIREVTSMVDNPDDPNFKDPMFTNIQSRQREKLDSLPVIIQRPERAERVDTLPQKRIASIGVVKSILFEDPSHAPVPILEVEIDGEVYVLCAFMTKKEEEAPVVDG